MIKLLSSVPSLQVNSDSDSIASVEREKSHNNNRFDGFITILLGNTTAAGTDASATIGQDAQTESFPTPDMTDLPPESFRITGGAVKQTFFLACNGLPIDPDRHTNVSFDKDAVHYGAVVAAYACLEKLGFAFLHPLEPYIPPEIGLEARTRGEVKSFGEGRSTEGLLCDNMHDLRTCSIDITESPHWPERNFHIHTQHPLELTEVLQGFDIPMHGPHGPHCAKFSKKQEAYKGTHTQGHHAEGSHEIPSEYCARWEDMVAEVDQMFQWAVANRLNKIEWLLLGNFRWDGDTEDLQNRQNRLSVLTNLGHEYSIMVGADVPLALRQQHSW